MTYATGRTYYDADSHIMELPNFLSAHADASVAGRLPELSFSSGGKLEKALANLRETGAHPPDVVDRLVGLGDGLIAGPKGYDALGAFSPAERSQALDLLGFDRQLVFATFSGGVCFADKGDLDVIYGACRAHNRAMAEFCRADPRLLGVGAVNLDDPERAVAELDWALANGLAAIWVPHRHCGGRSPGHDELDPFWARLAEAGVPFMLHVGGARLQIGGAWMQTGRPIPGDWLGGGENVRGKDMISLHHEAEKFVGAMVLDGVLQRHPKLRGGAIELGAGWVPAMLRRLDQIAEIWRRSEPDLAALTTKPSEQITEQLAFTPYPFEDVGAMIRDSNDRLYLFSSDYPHIEGGRNPIGRFETSLAGFGDDTLQRFYSDNFADILTV